MEKEPEETEEHLETVSHLPRVTGKKTELFLSNIRKEILNPENMRSVRPNLLKGERTALRELKKSNQIIRIQDKGSRFVSLNPADYEDKMFGQLNNELHYKSLQTDPTPKHILSVEKCCSKWLQKREISPEIANWVLNKNATPGTAFGNIETHKNGNPLRLITSCCGTAIENLSQFTEFYLQPLARKLPSFHHH